MWLLIAAVIVTVFLIVLFCNSKGESNTRGYSGYAAAAGKRFFNDQNKIK